MVYSGQLHPSIHPAAIESNRGGRRPAPARREISPAAGCLGENGWQTVGRCSSWPAFFVRRSPPIGVLQNDMAPESIDNPPFFDLFQGSKAAEAGKVVVQAAIAYARGPSGVVDITH